MKKIIFALTPLFMALAFSIDAYSQDVDRTSLVGTDETFWKRGYDGASGTLCDTKYAPMVTTLDGRTVQLVEDFQWGFNQLEVVLSQKVRGLENGNYTVVLYANAVSTHERDNFGGTPASNGATDVAYVFAGDKKVSVPVKVATVIDVNGEYTIANVEVTDGTLTLGLGTYKTGTNWHTIQIKSLIQHSPAQTFYEWKDGKYTERSVSEIDSITFSLPETATEGGKEEDDGTTGELGGLETFANGDFETWSGGKPTHWAPTTTAGNGTLSQSTDAHSGNYSVKVTGSTEGNKRIGYKEMTLEAGSYTMQFYTKAATAESGSVRPGYVPVTDGKVGTYMYDGEYTNDLTNTEWVLVTHQFELSAKTTVNLVIMNAKNPGKDVLIDDFTITKE